MKLSREESEALLQAGGAPAGARAPEVSPRDFRQPRRLSRELRQHLRARCDAALPAIERRLRGWLGAGATLSLEDVGELSAVGLFDELEEPFTLLELGAGEQLGWAALPHDAALALVARSVGAPPAVGAAPRRLTPLETGLIGDVLFELARGVGEALELALARGPLLQDARALRLRLPASLAREPQRVAVHLALEAPGVSAAVVRLYLPGVLAGARLAAARAVPPVLPAHISGVPLELSAQLGSTLVPLSDLLSLEVGDVVPLGLAEGAPAMILVEDQECGHAEWGGHEGGLALRILDFEPPEEEP